MKNIKFLFFALSLLEIGSNSVSAAINKPTTTSTTTTTTTTPSTTATTTTTTTTISTPQAPTTPPKKEINPKRTVDEISKTPTTPIAITTPVTNYCKTNIDALAKNDVNNFKKRFTNFYKKIPFDGHIKKNTKFYQALSWCLRNCITNNFFPTTETKNIVASLENDTTVYILQFTVISNATKRIQPDPINKYIVNKKDKDIHVIAITFLLNDVDDIKIDFIANDGTQKVMIDSIQQCLYATPNHYQDMIESLTHSGQENDILRKKNLEKIYNNIPAQFHIDREQFYQLILFWIITFFRDSFAQIEKCTQRGRADIIISGNKKNTIIEFKFNKTKDNALDQIDDRDYASCFNGDTKPITLIGINVDSRTNPGRIIVETISNIYTPVDISPIKIPVAKKLNMEEEEV